MQSTAPSVRLLGCMSMGSDFILGTTLAERQRNVDTNMPSGCFTFQRRLASPQEASVSLGKQADSLPPGPLVPPPGSSFLHTGRAFDQHRPEWSAGQRGEGSPQWGRGPRARQTFTNCGSFLFPAVAAVAFDTLGATAREVNRAQVWPAPGRDASRCEERVAEGHHGGRRIKRHESCSHVVRSLQHTDTLLALSMMPETSNCQSAAVRAALTQLFLEAFVLTVNATLLSQRLHPGSSAPMWPADGAWTGVVRSRGRTTGRPCLHYGRAPSHPHAAYQQSWPRSIYA
jgi:hypothetical protein